MKFASQFVHADYEAPTAWFRILFLQKSCKRAWLGVKDTLVTFKRPIKVEIKDGRFVFVVSKSRQFHDTHKGYHGRRKKRTDFAFSTPSTGVPLPGTKFPSALHAPPLIGKEKW